MGDEGVSGDDVKLVRVEIKIVQLDNFNQCQERLYIVG